MVGVALSGGGTRGAAHIGVLKALTEAGIRIDCISGTSSGSIVASLFAAGYGPREIERIFLQFETGVADMDLIKALPFAVDIMLFQRSKERRRMNLVDFDFLGLAVFLGNAVLHKNGKVDGFVKGNVIENTIYKYCSDKGVYAIKDAVVPIGIPAVDVNTAQTVMFVSDKTFFRDSQDTVYIDDALMAEAARASSAFPVVFKPKMFRGRRLIDGGVKDNVPVKVLKGMGADRVLAVNLGYSGQLEEDVDNLFEIATQSMNIMAYQMSKYTLDDADYVFKPEIYDVKLLETSRIQECIDRGYLSTRKVMPAIKEALGAGGMHVRHGKVSGTSY